jgi:outer membrane receptor protein involved in Fe transport
VRQAPRRQRVIFTSASHRYLIAAALALPCTARAQEGLTAATPRVEIVGIAPLYGLGTERELLPYPVQVATGTTMRKAGGENLGEFMNRELAGINSNEVSGSPFQSDITFHGFRASPVLGSPQGLSVYLDGVRVNEPFGDVINWDMLPEAAIGAVVLVPGANPLYGLNTLGGALAFTTKSGSTDPGGEVELSLTDRGRRRADLAYGWQGQGGWHGFVAGTLFDDAGWREHSSGRLGNGFVKLGRTGPSTDWSVSLQAGRSRLLGNGLLPQLLYDDERRAVYTYPDTTRNHLVQGTLNVVHHLDGDSEVTAIAYARNSRRDTVNGDVSDDYADYVRACAAGFDSDGTARDPTSCTLTQTQGAALHPAVLNTTSTRQNSQGASAALSARSGRIRWDAGASVDRSHVDYAQYAQQAFLTRGREVIADPEAASEPTSAVNGKSHAESAYAAASIELAEGTQLTASARYNRTQVTNTLRNADSAQPTEAFWYARVNPSLGLVHRLGSYATVFANAAQSNRVPTVIELGCADPDDPCRLPVGLQSDPYLKQVVSRSLEAGVRGKLAGEDNALSYALSLHRTVNHDDILFFSSPSGQGYFANVGRTRRQGLDLALTRKAGRLGLRLAYSYLQAVYDADAVLFTGVRHVATGPGTPIAGLPRHTAKLELDWAPNPQLSIGADVNAVSSLVTQGNEDGLARDPEPGEPPVRTDWRIGGYALLTLRTRYRPTDHWELFARLSNALDRRYETYGAVAADLFPHGRLIKPQDSVGDADNARFVAPGAPRTIVVGLRYTF